MSWSSAAIGAVELAALADDKPVLMASHAADWRTTAGARYSDRARWNEDGDYVAADAPATDMPTRRAVDRSGLLATSPSSAETTWYLVIDAQGSDAVDCVYLEHDGLDEVEDLTAEIEFSDASDFSSPSSGGALTIASGRCVTFLDDRWSGGGYLRLKLDAPDPFTPVVREFWPGRRRQLRRAPDRPADIERVTSSLFAPDSIGGEGFVRFAGRASFEWTMIARDTESSLADSETIEAWWAESLNGRRPSVVIPRPYSYPHRARIMSSAGDLSIVRSTWGERGYSLSLVEHPPILGGRS